MSNPYVTNFLSNNDATDSGQAQPATAFPVLTCSFPGLPDVGDAKNVKTLFVPGATGGTWTLAMAGVVGAAAATSTAGSSVVRISTAAPGGAGVTVDVTLPAAGTFMHTFPAVQIPAGAVLYVWPVAAIHSDLTVQINLER